MKVSAVMRPLTIYRSHEESFSPFDDSKITVKLILSSTSPIAKRRLRSTVSRTTEKLKNCKYLPTSITSAGITQMF